MIKDNKPLSMAEAKEYIKSKEEGKEMLGFIKKFSTLSPKEGKELREKLEKTGIIKLDEKNISKIIDILPDNPEDINKIFVGIGLDEEETKKVIETVREIK
ncbi:MAG: hypothetical protein ABIH59_01485 [archaeon]